MNDKWPAPRETFANYLTLTYRALRTHSTPKTYIGATRARTQTNGRPRVSANFTKTVRSAAGALLGKTHRSRHTTVAVASYACAREDVDSQKSVAPRPPLRWIQDCVSLPRATSEPHTHAVRYWLGAPPSRDQLIAANLNRRVRENHQTQNWRRLQNHKIAFRFEVTKRVVNLKAKLFTAAVVDAKKLTESLCQLSGNVERNKNASNYFNFAENRNQIVITNVMPHNAKNYQHRILKCTR